MQVALTNEEKAIIIHYLGIIAQQMKTNGAKKDAKTLNQVIKRISVNSPKVKIKTPFVYFIDKVMRQALELLKNSDLSNMTEEQKELANIRINQYISGAEAVVKKLGVERIEDNEPEASNDDQGNSTESEEVQSSTD